MRAPAGSRWPAFVLPLVLAGLLPVGGATPPATSPSDPSPGLSTDATGQLLLRGKPFRGLGVNVYDAFQRTLGPDSEHARPIEPLFRSLAAHGIPFVRFSAGGYWPLEWHLYRTNRDAHFQRLDVVIHAAERAGIGLIPSLFWHPPTLSDLAGEPFQDWGHRESKTFALMQTYTREVLQRYRDSQAVWAWEFGNEFNLPADLPNAAEHRPPVVPHAGTPATRSARDELTHAAFRTALSGFAEEARRWDSRRLLLSGNAFPRSSAWHQLHHQSWDRDSREQWTTMLLDDHPAPISCLSGRLYSADDLHQLPWAAAAARASHRPLFIGEFGVPGRLDDPALARFQEQLDALDTHTIPLAALWVVDFDGQAADWNVTEDNARAPLLRLLEQRNRTWRAAQPAAASPRLPQTP